MPSTAWIFDTTSLPSASMLAASTRTTTSYGPVTISAERTPWIAPTASTREAIPTPAWISTNAWTIAIPRQGSRGLPNSSSGSLTD
jgi:hypothetical protein